MDTAVARVVERTAVDRARRESARIEKRRRDISDQLALLQTEQEAAVESYITAQTPVIREKLEQRVQELEDKIRELGSHTPPEAEGSQRDEIQAWLAWAAETVEHPAKVLRNSENTERQRAFFGLIFKTLPTYDEIANGTPNILPGFALKDDLEETKSPMVTPRGLGWNTIETIVQRWRRAARYLRQPREEPSTDNQQNSG